MKHLQCVVIGGGISGLTSAYYLQKAAAIAGIPLKTILVEGGRRLGGKIWSQHEDGFLCEWGPNGFLNNKPDTLKLCQELGLQEKLVYSNDHARERFIYANGHLHRLPHGIVDFVRSDLLSWSAKLRCAGEIFVPKGSVNVDESLADFAIRRLGREALDKLITPMAGGIFAGDPATMSLRASFPRIYELEHNYGSLLMAAIRLSRRASVSAKRASASGPGGVLTSFAGGLEILTTALATKFGVENIVYDKKISAITYNGAQYRLHSAGEVITADAVICASEAHSAAQIFYDFDTKLSQQLAQIQYAPLAVVCHGYAPGVLNRDLPGFGYLLSANEAIPVLGTLWDSSIFPQRAPDGGALLRTMVGGARFPLLAELDDSNLLELVKKSLETILGINSQATLERVYRHPLAIPRYDLGHIELVKKIEAQAAIHQGLFFAGNAYHGVGINDCVARGSVVAAKVMQQLLRSRA